MSKKIVCDICKDDMIRQNHYFRVQEMSSEGKRDLDICDICFARFKMFCNLEEHNTREE